MLTCCSSKKEKEPRVVTADIKRKRYVARTAADRPQRTVRLTPEDSIRQAEAREREERKTKTIVIESANKFHLAIAYAHVELAPDGTLKGNADFLNDALRFHNVEFVGSWRTGSISRGMSNITYYELDIKDDEWYCTEKFDYLWRGENAYSDMRSNDIDKAGEIIKLKYV